VGQKILARPYYSQRTVFASLLSAFFILEVGLAFLSIYPSLSHHFQKAICPKKHDQSMLTFFSKSFTLSITLLRSSLDLSKISLPFASHSTSKKLPTIEQLSTYLMHTVLQSSIHIFCAADKD